MRAPCEVSLWYVLPLIRRCLARDLMENHGMTQAAIARKLSLTDAAVSQYITGKRGSEDPDCSSISAKIATAAKMAVKAKDDKAIQNEICRLCKHISTHKKFVEMMAEKECAKCK